jgi:hypothetical protein
MMVSPNWAALIAAWIFPPAGTTIVAALVALQIKRIANETMIDRTTSFRGNKVFVMRLLASHTHPYRVGVTK